MNVEDAEEGPSRVVCFILEELVVSVKKNDLSCLYQRVFQYFVK